VAAATKEDRRHRSQFVQVIIIRRLSAAFVPDRLIVHYDHFSLA